MMMKQNNSITKRKMRDIEGLHYHEKTKALHLRLDKHQVLSDIVCLLEHHQQQQQQQQHDNNLNNDDDEEHEKQTNDENENIVIAPLFPFMDCESIHISIGETFLQPHLHESNIENFISLCHVIGKSFSFSSCREVRIARAIAGFVNSNAGGAWCPVEGIQILLQQTYHTLQIFMLRNLQIYSIIGYQQQQQQQQQEQGDHNGHDTTTIIESSPVYLLADALKEHPTLSRFGWQHCAFVPRMSRTTGYHLDPLLQSLSTIPKLMDMLVQSPPWFTNLVPVNPKILSTLIGPSIQGLCLDGFYLEAKHLRNLLLVSSHQEEKRQEQQEQCTTSSSLTTLSLTLQLSLDSVRELACILGKILQRISLRQISVRLEWCKTERCTLPQKVHGLQSFQDILAHSLLDNINNYNNRNHRNHHHHHHHNVALSSSQQQQTLPLQSSCLLQHLDLIYYDSSHRWDTTTPPMICPRSFQQVLEKHYQLTHLRLPYCGEMDPTIDFLLKLNRTGLREKLLLLTNADSVDDRNGCVGMGGYGSENCCGNNSKGTIAPTMKAKGFFSSSREEAGVQGLLQIQQEQPKVCWNASPNRTTTIPLSMMYYLLHEMPGMFLR